MKKKQKICLGLTSELVSVSSLHVSLSMLSWRVCSLRRGVILISSDGGDGCYGLRILFSTLIIHGLHSAFSQSEPTINLAKIFVVTLPDHIGPGGAGPLMNI